MLKQGHAQTFSLTRFRLEAEQFQQISWINFQRLFLKIFIFGQLFKPMSHTTLGDWKVCKTITFIITFKYSGRCLMGSRLCYHSVNVINYSKNSKFLLAFTQSANHRVYLVKVIICLIRSVSLDPKKIHYEEGTYWCFWNVSFPHSLKGFFLPELKHPLRYGANVMKTCSQNKKNIGGSRYIILTDFVLHRLDWTMVPNEHVRHHLLIKI